MSKVICPTPCSHCSIPPASFFPISSPPIVLGFGPVPAGVPVDLLANLEDVTPSEDHTNQAKHDEELLALLLRIKHDLKAAEGQAVNRLSNQAFSNLVPTVDETQQMPRFHCQSRPLFRHQFPGAGRIGNRKEGTRGGTWTQ